jgi:hypothetical protein
MLAVRWYLRYGLSYRDVEDLLAERGITVDHVRWGGWAARGTRLTVPLTGEPPRRVVLAGSAAVPLWQVRAISVDTDDGRRLAYAHSDPPGPGVHSGLCPRPQSGQQHSHYCRRRAQTGPHPRRNRRDLHRARPRLDCDGAGPNARRRRRQHTLAHRAQAGPASGPFRHARAESSVASGCAACSVAEAHRVSAGEASSTRFDDQSACAGGSSPVVMA